MATIGAESHRNTDSDDARQLSCLWLFLAVAALIVALPGSSIWGDVMRKRLVQGQLAGFSRTVWAEGQKEATMSDPKKDHKASAEEMMDRIKEAIIKPDAKTERLKITESLVNAWIHLYNEVVK